MGLFGKRTGELGTFQSRHSASDIVKVIYVGLADQLSSSDPSEPAPFELSAPRIMESIYISRLDSDGITVTAGNSIETYFEFNADIKTTAVGCEGHVYFDRPSRQIQKWTGNAIKITGGITIALQGASVKFVNWRGQF